MEILKWVLIVLAAGFVGQFGKRLADHLIARSRRRKAERRSSAAEGPVPSQSPPAERAPVEASSVSSKEATKVAKKVAKAEAKRAKKTTE